MTERSTAWLLVLPFCIACWIGLGWVIAAAIEAAPGAIVGLAMWVSGT